MKYSFQKPAIIGLVSHGLILACSLTMAGPVTVPNAFTAGTTARASEVNENFSAVETAVDDNDSRISSNANAVAGIATNDTAISGNTTAIADNSAAIQANSALGLIVLDGNDVEIGQLLTIGFENRSLKIITPEGYIQRLSTGAGIVGGTFDPGTLQFASTDCTGTAYSSDRNAFGGFVVSLYDLTGVPSLYYVDKASPPVINFSIASASSSGGCVTFGPSVPIQGLFPVIPNSPTVTGISTDSYQLPLKIMRP